jgi:hypothetical protein
MPMTRRCSGIGALSGLRHFHRRLGHGQLLVARRSIIAAVIPCAGILLTVSRSTHQLAA